MRGRSLKNIKRFTDYRTYLSFDLEVTDESGSNSGFQRLCIKNPAVRPRRLSIYPFWLPLHSCTA